MKSFQVGKLSIGYLEKLLGAVPIRDQRVIVGPKVGEDAAVIDIGDKYLIAKTDPITFATDRIGWYAVNVNANDIAVMGGTPKWFLATVLLPEGKTDKKLVDGIFKDIVNTCQELGITLCGGHTEISYALDRPIVVGQMLGEVAKHRLVAKSKIKPGCAILLTKGIAIEGTAVVAREKGAQLKGKLGARARKRASNFLFDPGISVVNDARAAGRAATIYAMHDPTEGGLLGGLYELAKAGDTGLFIHADDVNVFPETKLVCREFQLDPMGLIASGALLIVVDAQDAARVRRALERANIQSDVIGFTVNKAEGIRMRKGSDVLGIKPPAVDEITKIF
jgi:hydrogenase maturation factor